MTRPTRRPRTASRRSLAVTVALLCLVGAAACDLQAGSAAIVGSQRISDRELQDHVRDGLTDKAVADQVGQDRPRYVRLVLTRLIQHELLVRAAKDAGVDVSAGDIDAAVQDSVERAGGTRNAAQSLAQQQAVAASDVRRFQEDAALRDALGDTLVADVNVPGPRLQQAYAQNAEQFDLVRIRGIVVKDEATAQKVLGEVKADPRRFADLARQYDDRIADPFLNPRQGPFQTAKAGQFLVVPTETSQVVVQVLGLVKQDAAAATPLLRRSLLRSQIQTKTGEALRRAAKELGVKVNPRYGRWDARQLSVVARTSGVVKDASPSAAPSAPGDQQGGQPGGQQGGQQQPGSPQPSEQPSPSAS